MLVLAGAGEAAFCAGADLKAIDTLDADAPGGPLGFTRLASPKPTVAAISGWCLAGGLELALWCDLRVAAETATFGCAERRWGVPLMDGGTQRLARIVGQGRALDLVLTGRMVGAAQAHAMGLVTEVVPPGASGSSVSIALRSAPAQNACSPAPVSTSTRAPSSERNASKPSSSAAAVGPSTALRRSGRSIVSSAAAPRRS